MGILDRWRRRRERIGPFFIDLPQSNDRTITWPSAVSRTSEEKPTHDEPDWHEPTDAERAWAISTMPGKAEGHTIAWRAWDLHQNVPSTDVDALTTRELLGLSSHEAWRKLFDAYSQIEALRHSKEPLYLLESTSFTHCWKPGEPVIAEDMVAALNLPPLHVLKPGIYATKTAQQVAGGTIIGQAALWGEIVEHERGYRARYAYPVKLWVTSRDQSVADALAKAYDVPVELGYPEGVSEIDRDIQWANRQMSLTYRAAQRAAIWRGCAV